MSVCFITIAKFIIYYIIILSYSDCNCNAEGSISLSCNLDGQCFCRNSTEGPQCDICSNGTFNLDSSNNDSGCQPCYCSGVSSNCSSSSGFVASQIVATFTTEDDTWTIKEPTNAQLAGGAVMNVSPGTPEYLLAPADYLGNKLGSYRQYLQVNVSIGNLENSASKGYDVLITSTGNPLVNNFTKLVSGSQSLSIRFIEGEGWIDLDTDLPATAYDLQSTLINVTRLQIRATLGSDVVFSSISMDTVSEGGTSEIGWVEQCVCPFNYSGLSCEQCADGFTRDNVSGLCIACTCNGNTDLCDKENGRCINCSGNTTGDSCEKCLDGYYGDPTMNIPCLRCMCPLLDGQYSPTCELIGGNNYTCAECFEGHGGDKCETCEAGYFGDPLGMFGNSTKCTDCSCNGNINVTDPDSCNKINGTCTKCLYNTTGNECENCLDEYYGDPVNAKNCTGIAFAMINFRYCIIINCYIIHPVCNFNYFLTIRNSKLRISNIKTIYSRLSLSCIFLIHTACNCSSIGTDSNNRQCDSMGYCNCLPNVTGSKCDQCAPLHYNLSSTGCEPCDCDPDGSMEEHGCDVITGQCMCKENVTERRCDMCADGYFDFEAGCIGM